MNRLNSLDNVNIYIYCLLHCRSIEKSLKWCNGDPVRGIKQASVYTWYSTGATHPQTSVRIYCYIGAERTTQANACDSVGSAYRYFVVWLSLSITIVWQIEGKVVLKTIESETWSPIARHRAFLIADINYFSCESHMLWRRDATCLVKIERLRCVYFEASNRKFGF